METSKQLAERLKSAAKTAGIAHTTFCHRHFGNHRLVERLEGGGGYTSKTYQKVLNLLGPPAAEAVAND